ncbi:acyl-CoA N-acyltransferase [Trichoderma barbatum]
MPLNDYKKSAGMSKRFKIALIRATRCFSSPSSQTPAAPKMPPAPILKLKSCLVRAYDEGDVKSLARAANNPKISRWMRNTFPQPYTTDDAKKWISIANYASPMRDFAICQLDGSVVIGGIGLKARDDIHYRTMEIGYWLSEDRWHQGIATEVVIAFSDWAFENFKQLLRLEAEVLEGNVGSCRVLEKAGFVFEARQKNAVEKMGAVMDTFIYCKFR